LRAAWKSAFSVIWWFAEHDLVHNWDADVRIRAGLLPLQADVNLLSPETSQAIQVERLIS
jgi:hypothetical protein